MSKKKVDLALEEDMVVDNVIIDSAPDGEMLKSINYFEKLDETTYPRDEYDVVVHKMIERPGYLIGTVASVSRDALKKNGKFILDVNGYAGDLDHLRAVIEYIGLDYESEKDGVFVYVKR